MTAVKSVKAETRLERIAREKQAWIQEAIAYMVHLDMFDDCEKDQEWVSQLAESLYEGSIGLSGIECTPQEAVDEELTYWGD